MTAQKIKLHWELAYMLILTALILALAASIKTIPALFAGIGFISSLAGSFLAWRRKLSARVLYLQNLLHIIFALSLAFLLSRFVLVSTDRIIGAISGVILMDLFSFTRRGRGTLNAKLMSKNTTAARLSFCLPVPQKQGLSAIIGVGDLTFYALMMLLAMKADGMSALQTGLIILLGQLLNQAVILLIKDKKGYKGFPATLMPGLLFIACIAFGLFQLQ